MRFILRIEELSCRGTKDHDVWILAGVSCMMFTMEIEMRALAMPLPQHLNVLFLTNDKAKRRCSTERLLRTTRHIRVHATVPIAKYMMPRILLATAIADETPNATGSI